jgi:hypothetical protein
MGQPVFRDHALAAFGLEHRGALEERLLRTPAELREPVSASEIASLADADGIAGWVGPVLARAALLHLARRVGVDVWQLDPVVTRLLPEAWPVRLSSKP